jgi:Mg2+ and Co2+ transporter CorA
LEKIGAITRCSNAIDREAELRGMELAAETNKVAKKTERISEALYEKTGAIKEQSQEVYERAGDIQHSFESFRRTWSSDTEAREKAAIEREEVAAKQREELLERVNNHNDELEQHSQVIRQALNSIADLLAKSPQLKDMQEVGSLFPPKPSRPIP